MRVCSGARLFGCALDRGRVDLMDDAAAQQNASIAGLSA